MRRVSLLLLLLGLPACEPTYMPKRSLSGQVARDHPDAGALWPVLLQHCLRAASCDPMSNFGEGAGQASGIIGSTTYFVETAKAVREGGRDQGAAITLSLQADRGRGGQAGRPA
ncbi:MAG: hypothetical protein SGJ21_15060, partial [Alphaproteobacteria bacterium]|nr:hypothetical protein [Alphaproteobacteria bacterium]